MKQLQKMENDQQNTQPTNHLVMDETIHKKIVQSLSNIYTQQTDANKFFRHSNDIYITDIANVVVPEDFSIFMIVL